MLKTTDTLTIYVKRHSKSIRQNLTYAIVLLVILAIAYFIYYGILINDPEMLDYTKVAFDPIADIFFPGNTDNTKYQQTGVYLLAMIIPVFLLYTAVECIEKIVISANDKITDINISRQKKEKEKKYIKQFTDIKYFAIGISFDYIKNGAPVSIKAANQLNQILGEKISTCSFAKAIVTNQGIVAISSSDFEHYDFYLETVLKRLAKTRKLLQDKYQLNIIATITTDAYEALPNHNKILNTHYVIKGCNLKNKVITTSTFLKKYNFLDLSKYGGTSIGLYDQSMNQDELLDLNVVNKDLSAALDKIAQKTQEQD